MRTGPKIDPARAARGGACRRRAAPVPRRPAIEWPVELVIEQLMRLRAGDLESVKVLEEARCPILEMAGHSEKVLKVAEIGYL